jgi:hypothetical protein
MRTRLLIACDAWPKRRGNVNRSVRFSRGEGRSDGLRFVAPVRLATRLGQAFERQPLSHAQEIVVRRVPGMA